MASPSWPEPAQYRLHGPDLARSLSASSPSVPILGWRCFLHHLGWPFYVGVPVAALLCFVAALRLPAGAAAAHAAESMLSTFAVAVVTPQAPGREKKIEWLTGGVRGSSWKTVFPGSAGRSSGLGHHGLRCGSACASAGAADSRSQFGYRPDACATSRSRRRAARHHRPWCTQMFASARRSPAWPVP